VHGSDSVVSAERELGLFFTPSELYDYEVTMGAWR